ncbi:MAG: hypothetical protein JWO22_1756 [Frankiales bacterium]|nr:hypothetical protein [Frankiales bacterium]
MMKALRRRRSSDQDGFSLIELLVSMVILAVVFAIVIGATTTMYKAMRKQSAASDAVDQTRKVVSVFDKQVRYANAITVEGYNAGATALYVELKSGITGARQTCTQWRFTAASKTLEYRTWQPILNTGDVVTVGAWKSVSKAVLPPATGTVFKTSYLTAADNGTAPAGFYGYTQNASVPHEALRVSFIAAFGSPKAKQASDVSFTALNTVNSLAPASGTCNEGGRP